MESFLLAASPGIAFGIFALAYWTYCEFAHWRLMKSIPALIETQRRIWRTKQERDFRFWLAKQPEDIQKVART